MKGVQIPTYDGVGVISGEHGGGELKSLKSQRAKKKNHKGNYRWGIDNRNNVCVREEDHDC